MGSPERATSIAADATEPAAAVLFLADAGTRFEAVASLLDAEYGIDVTVASDPRVALDRSGSVDCVVRASRFADREPTSADALDAIGTTFESLPTVLVCADGHEAARALSAGADRCVPDEGGPAALAAHLAAAIHRERNDRERERARREEREFPTSALDTLPDAFYAVDPDGRLTHWNDRLNEITGYTDAELAGMDPLSLVAEDDRESVAEAMAIVFAGGETQTRDSRLLRKNGEEIPYEFNGSALTDADGGITGLAGTAREVTERRHRERALRHQADRLERLDRINAVIRDVDRALVRASTREEVEREVCERLASASPYRLAWIGEKNGKGVQPRTWAGADDSLDTGNAEESDRDEDAGSTEATSDGSEAGDAGRAWTAIRTGETQVLRDVAGESTHEPGCEAALDREYRSGAAVPLTYRGTTYGVLCVHASDPNAFEDTERTVFEELAGTIAYAISAAERRRALMTDTVSEVTLAIRDPSGFLLALSADLDCHLALDGLVPQSDGSLAEFVSIEGVPASAVLERASEAGVEATVVSEAGDHDPEDADGESVVRFLVPGHDASISAALADHGGVLTEATAEGGEARIVAEFPTDTDVRAVLAALEANYPDTELLARREHERTDASGTRLRGALADALTDRQHEVLERAYRAGYFEWPRESSGEELANALDVAKPTLHEHLRAAERKLLGTFFEQRSPESDAP